jgi:hypothetical protein
MRSQHGEVWINVSAAISLFSGTPLSFADISAQQTWQRSSALPADFGTQLHSAGSLDADSWPRRCQEEAVSFRHVKSSHSTPSVPDTAGNRRACLKRCKVGIASAQDDPTFRPKAHVAINWCPATKKIRMLFHPRLCSRPREAA